MKHKETLEELSWRLCHNSTWIRYSLERIMDEIGKIAE